VKSHIHLKVKSHIHLKVKSHIHHKVKSHNSFLQADQLEIMHGKVVLRNPSWNVPLMRAPPSRRQGSVAMTFGVAMTSLFELMEEEDEV